MGNVRILKRRSLCCVLAGPWAGPVPAGADRPAPLVLGPSYQAGPTQTHANHTVQVQITH